MNTKDTYFFVIICVGLLVSLLGLIFSKLIINTVYWVYIGLVISEIAGFIILLTNETFIKSKYFRVLKGVISIVIIGVLFKLMRWPFLNVILSIGFISIIAVYLYSFIDKPIKKRLDFIKLFWVIVAIGGALLSLLHFINKDYQILSSTLMWLAIIDYFKTNIEKQKSLNKKQQH